MALLRIFNVIQDCNLNDPRGGQVAFITAGVSHELALSREIIELVADQLEGLHGAGVLDYEIGDDPFMDNQAESASLADISQAASSSAFVALVGSGPGDDYTELGAALLAYVASDSKTAFIYITSSVSFGTSDVTTNKVVTIGRLYGAGSTPNVSWGVDSGIWTHDHITAIELVGVVLGSLASNNRGYITTTTSSLTFQSSTLVCALMSSGVIPIIIAPLSWVSLVGRFVIGWDHIAIEADFIDMTLLGESDLIGSVLSYITAYGLSYSDDIRGIENLVYADAWWTYSTSQAKYNNYVTDIVDPTVTDDIAASFPIGCHWLNTVNDKIWVCLDNIIGAAVWKRLAWSDEAGIFSATIGVDFPSLSETLIAFEASDAASAIIYVSNFTDFGTTTVTTTKPVILRGGSSWSLNWTSDYGITWSVTSGKWIYTPQQLRIEGVYLGNWGKIDEECIEIFSFDGNSALFIGPETTLDSHEIAHPFIQISSVALTYISCIGTKWTVWPDNSYLFHSDSIKTFFELYHSRVDRYPLVTDLGVPWSTFILYDCETQFYDGYPGYLSGIVFSPISQSQFFKYYVYDADPGVNDDKNKFFGKGSYWIDVVSKKLWVCQDETIGAAVWSQIAQSKTTNVAPTVNDDLDNGFAIGAYWIDTSDSNRVWYCISNASGAAVWQHQSIDTEGAGDPNAVVTGRRHDNYYDTVGATFYRCTSSPTGTVWVAI